jgi:phage shock protein A
MALIRRLRRITIGRIETFLASLETPEMVLPQLVRELADAVSQAARAEAKALSAVKAAQRRSDEAAGKVLRFAEGAKLAVANGDEDLARRALVAQIQSESQAESASQELQRTTEAYGQARAVRKQLQDSHNQLKKRAEDIIRRDKANRTAAKAMEARFDKVGAKGQKLLDKVARMSDAVDEKSDEIQAAAEVLGQLAAEEELGDLDELSHHAEVQRRLDSLGDQNA